MKDIIDDASTLSSAN